MFFNSIHFLSKTKSMHLHKALFHIFCIILKISTYKLTSYLLGAQKWTSKNCAYLKTSSLRWELP